MEPAGRGSLVILRERGEEWSVVLQLHEPFHL